MDPKLAALLERRKKKHEDDGDAGFYNQDDEPPPPKPPRSQAPAPATGEIALEKGRVFTIILSFINHHVALSVLW
jgi:hypothetical protein